MIYKIIIDLIIAMRPKQWTKNLIFFFVLIFSRNLLVYPKLLLTIMAFFYSVFFLALFILSMIYFGMILLEEEGFGIYLGLIGENYLWDIETIILPISF